MFLATTPTVVFAGPPDGGDPTAPASTAAPSTDGVKAAILPLLIQEGEITDADRTALTDKLVSGLQRGSFDVVLPDAVVAADASAAECAAKSCYTGIASSTNATHVVQARVGIVDRDYTLRVELIDGTSGAVVASSDDACEICGVAEVQDMIASAAATLNSKLEALASGPATLSLTANPVGAVVALDGEVIGVAPLTDTPVIPGDHVLRISNEGYITIEREVTFVEGVSETLDFSLEQVPSRLPSRRWGWVSLGVGIGALGGGVAMIYLHDQPHNLACDSADGTQDANGNCKYLWDTKWQGAAASIAGAALLTLGVAILVDSSKREKKAKKDKKTARRRPNFGVGPGSVSVSGRF